MERSIAGFLLGEVEAHPVDLVARATDRFAISRQAVHQHLSSLIERGLISAAGRTRARRYAIRILSEVEEVVSSAAEPEEGTVWRRRFLPALEGVPGNVVEIARFGFTEVVRNALEHSGMREVSARLRRTGASLDLRVADRGVGILGRLAEELGLDDPRRAALEIAKGEVTTHRDRTSGRGLSVVAASFDAFLLASGSHVLRREAREGGGSWRLEPIQARVRGTTVGMRIGVRSRRTLAEVLADGIAAEGNAARARTVIPVHLALEDSEQPTSREQARRLSRRIERFGEFVLDFDGIASVGPAFADEIFRVVRGQHPGVLVSWRNAAPAVEKVLGRAVEDHASRTPRCGPGETGI